jgi:GTP cyclohydrolase IA
MAKVISLRELFARAERTVRQICEETPPPANVLHPFCVYGIPRGGIPAALVVALVGVRSIQLVDDINQAHCCVDDIVDTGQTADRIFRDHGLKTFALVDRRIEKTDDWVVFPWEGDSIGSFEDNVTRLLQFVGEDPAREGLKETPKRVTKAWEHWCSGYKMQPAEILKAFEDGAEKCDEMVVVEHIPIYSHCEHHLAPIFGHATIAYIPDKRIVGLSKLNRLAEVFALRLQVQERMTNQIADALMEHLKPRGCGVVVRARHMCMESRGVRQNSLTTTSALRGVFTDSTVRAEFLSLARGADKC